MKRILLFSAIILSAFNIYASTQWIYIITSSNDDVFFIEANSIQNSGDSYTYWTKVNYARRNDDGDLSMKAQYTINCRTREVTPRYFIFYDDIDHKGKTTSSSHAKSGWVPIPPNTVNWSYYSHVCNK